MVRYHFTNRMAIIIKKKKRQEITGVGKDVEKSGPSSTVGGNVKCYLPLWKNMKFPEEIENKTTMWSSNFTSEYLFKENENANSKLYVYLHVYCSIIGCRQDVEACLHNGWMNKESV